MKQARSYDCAIKHWVDVAIYGSERYLNDRGHYGSRIQTGNAGQVFSYGSHFEMARVLYDKKGDARAILINGERASNTTTKHQGYVRGAVQRSGLPSAIIPYGALEAASIDLASIQFLHTQPDKWLDIKHESVNPPRWAEYIDEPVMDDGEWSDEEKARWNEWVDWRDHVGQIDAARRDLERGIEAWHELVEGGEDPYGTRASKVGDLPKTYAKLEELKASEPKNLGLPSGWHGQPGCATRVPPPQMLVPTGERVQGYVHRDRVGRVSGVLADGTACRGVRPDRELHGPEDDGVWRWSTRRHILGESVIAADVNSHRMVTCERCNGDGYDKGDNLPSLPDPMQWRGMEIGDEYVTLAMRTDVQLPVPSTDGNDYTSDYYQRFPQSIERDYRYDRKLWTTHTYPVWGALPQPRDAYDCRTCRGTGRVRQPIKRRAVKFLSGFDHGEPHLAYFFCELPKCDATTVDEAYEALKPEVVKLAEQMGRNVLRQGDIFAVETTETTASLKKKAKVLGRRNPKKTRTIVERGMKQANLFGSVTSPVLSRTVEEIGDDEQARVRAASMLLGTNHQGTEVIQTHDGTIYARGCLWHVPDGRTNDHVRVKLGKAWHIIVKNTVPVRRAR